MHAARRVSPLAVWGRLRACLGPRGATLAAVGLLWVWYGVGVVVTTRRSLDHGTQSITSLMPVAAWGAVWSVCGLAALVAALLRAGRDAWGFAAASAPPIVWTMAFAAAAVTGEYPQGWAFVPLSASPVVLLSGVASLTRTDGEGVADGR